MRKKNLELKTTNNQVDASTQTPIEIALKIDENGMTTASQLYSFLELHPAHFSDWCRRNIKNNKFATKNIDYFPFTVESERNKPKNPKPRTDYKLTSDFAKELSMTGNTEKHEQAKQYFIACEQGLKIATQKLQSTSINTQPLAEAITTLTQTVIKLQEDVSSLKESTSKKQTPEKKYSRWKTNTFKKLAIITQFANEHGQDLQLKDSIHITVKEFEDTYNIELSDYVQAYKSEFGMENDPYVMNVIDHYKEIRDLYTMTLDGIMQKLNLQTENNTVTKNIFDTLAMELCQEENKGE